MFGGLFLIGIVVFVFIFNLIQYFNYKDKVFLYYSLYLLSASISIFIFFNASILIINFSPAGSPLISILSFLYLLYIYSYLKNNSILSNLRKFIKYFLALHIISIFIPSSFMLFLSIFFLGGWGWIIYLVANQKKHHFKFASIGIIFFGLSVGFPLIPILISIICDLLNFDSFLFFQITFWFCFILEILFFSLELGARGRWLLIEKNKTHLKLQVSEIKALKAQMNPHFVSNCLEAIKLLIESDETKKSITYLSIFSELVRLVVEKSMKEKIRLSEELKICDLYLEMEALRLESEFKYSIKVQEQIDPSFWNVPPFILQPFLENAIWHGLVPKKEGVKEISIEVLSYGEGIKCIILDTGIGREQSQALANNPKRESIGIRNTEERLSLINQLNNSKLSFNIYDLYNSAKESIGTRVELLTT